MKKDLVIIEIVGGHLVYAGVRQPFKVDVLVSRTVILSVRLVSGRLGHDFIELRCEVVLAMNVLLDGSHLVVLKV